MSAIEILENKSNSCRWTSSNKVAERVWEKYGDFDDTLTPGANCPAPRPPRLNACARASRTLSSACYAWWLTSRVLVSRHAMNSSGVSSKRKGTGIRRGGCVLRRARAGSRPKNSLLKSCRLFSKPVCQDPERFPFASRLTLKKPKCQTRGRIPVFFVVKRQDFRSDYQHHLARRAESGGTAATAEMKSPRTLRSRSVRAQLDLPDFFHYLAGNHLLFFLRERKN